MLPCRTMETSSSDTPVIVSSVIGGVDALGESPTMVDPVSESIDGPPFPLCSSSANISPASPEPDTAPIQPCWVISLSNFKQTLKEITPFMSASLGALNELRK